MEFGKVSKEMERTIGTIATQTQKQTKKFTKADFARMVITNVHTSVALKPTPREPVEFDSENSDWDVSIDFHSFKCRRLD